MRLLTTFAIANGIGSTSKSVPSTVTVPAPVDLSVCHDAPKKRKVEFEFDCDCDLELESLSKLESESESESDTMLSHAKRFARRNSSVRLSNTYSNGPSNAYQ